MNITEPHVTFVHTSPTGRSGPDGTYIMGSKTTTFWSDGRVDRTHKDHVTMVWTNPTPNRWERFRNWLVALIVTK